VGLGAKLGGKDAGALPRRLHRVEQHHR
jgi:hypothetical protein